MKKFNSFEELSEYASKFGMDARGFRPSELSFSKGIIKIPLEPKFGRSKVRCLKINVLEGGQKLSSGLLWHAIFGTRYKTVYNLIFFEVLNRATIWSPLTQCIFDVLMLTNSTAKAGSSENLFYQNLKCVRKILPSNELQKILSTLSQAGLSLPHRAPDLKGLLTISESYIYQNKAPEVRRIGVGYKDKGNLPLPGSEYNPDEITPYSAPSTYKLWEQLLRNFHSNGFSIQL